jgi:hypothetical protein
MYALTRNHIIDWFRTGLPFLLVDAVRVAGVVATEAGFNGSAQTICFRRWWRLQARFVFNRIATDGRRAVPDRDRDSALW